MLFTKNTSIPWDTYWKLVKPKYKYIKIIPDKSIIKNYNTTTISRAIKSTHKSILKRVKIEQNKIWLETNFKISYMIDIRKNNTEFIFVVPEIYCNLIIEKIKEIWTKCTVEIIDEIEKHSKEVDCYQLSYKNEDALSLNIKNDNVFMDSILGSMKMLKDNDRITIIYNFIPCNNYGWDKTYENTIGKLRLGKSVLKDKITFEHLTISILTAFCNLADGIISGIGEFMGAKNKNENLILEKFSSYFDIKFVTSNETKRKKDNGILQTQIVYLNDGKDVNRKNENALSINNAFRTLDGDNELVSKKVKKTFEIEDYKYKNIDINKLSVEECQNFIQVPNRYQLSDFGINHINIAENAVPKKLQKGYVKLGEVVNQGEKFTAYLEDDYNIGSLPLLLVGPQGMGKSTFIAHLHKYANSRKEGGFLIDFIKKNELTEEVLKFVPKEDVILLDYSKEECIQGFAFNELSVDKKIDPYSKIKMASMQAQRVLELVNSINLDNQLAPRMRKYLTAAATVVFATGECSLKSVIACLENHEKRHGYIKSITDKRQIEFLESKINDLYELDDWSKPTKEDPIPVVCGTKDSRIDGILDRISLLREDFDLEYMFNKGEKGNINIAEELEKGKLIIVKMLQDEFSDHAKNVITTFLMSKIWIATEIRGRWNTRPKRTYITVDEIFQTPTAMDMLTEKKILPQTRKFGCKFNLTCQSFNQMKKLTDSLQDAGATFMLLKGTKENDFEKLKERINGFEYEDISNMKRFHSLNVVNYSEGNASFISRLPYEL